MRTGSPSSFLCRNKHFFFFQHLTNSSAYPSYNEPIIVGERRWDVYYELYIDVFFLVNFMMDYLLLRLTGKMMKCSATHGRIVAGAAAGALCACAAMVIPWINTFVKFILLHAAGSILMVKIGFKIGWDRTFLRACIMLYISAFLVGGVMEYFHQYVRRASLFFALALVGYFVSLGIWELVTYLAGRNIVRCKVRLIKEDREYMAEALIDTGNRLRDPATGKPVSIISARAWEMLGAKESCYIPYHSVGKPDGVLPAAALDKMCVYGKAPVWLDRPIVAVCEDITDDDYEMLVHPDLL